MHCEVARLEDETIDGARVERLRLRAGSTSMECLGLGCAITRLETPDRDGRRADVVLGYRDAQDYANDARREYFGVVAGRVANRIGGARFVLDGHEHRLATNDGPNHLHGGRRGFDRRVWTVVEARDGEAASVRFRLVSADREEGNELNSVFHNVLHLSIAPGVTVRTHRVF